MNCKKIIQLVKGYLLKNWRKTFLIVLILSFTISGYLLINETFINVQATNLNIAESSYGKWHFLYKYVSQDEIDKIKKEDSISQIGCEWVIGTSDTGVLLLYRDEIYNELDSTKFSLEKGVFPEKDDEIVVTQSYADNEGVKIGDVINLSYEKIDYYTGDSLFTDRHSFKITGILKNYDIDDTMKIGIVSKELKDYYADRIEIENIYGTFYNTGNIKGYAKQLYLNCKLRSDIKLNDHIIFAEQDNSVYKLVNYIINFIIWIISALLIYNILYFMLMGQKKDLSILRSIGFDNRDLKRCIIWEVLALLIISVPLGILLGILLNSILFDKLTRLILSVETGYVIDSSISPEVIILSIAMIVLSVIPAIIIPLREFGKLTPVELRNSREDTDISRKWIINTLLKLNDGKLYEFGIKSLARNRKKTTITVITTFLSIMVISVILFMDSFEIDDGSWIKGFIPEDVRITTDRNNGQLINNDILNEIEHIKGVESIQAYQLADVWFSVPIDDINKNSGLYKKMDEETKKANVFTDEDNVQRFCFNVTAIACKDLSEYLEPGKKEEHCIVVSHDISEYLTDGTRISVFDMDKNGKDTNMQHVKIGNVIDQFDFMPEDGIGVTRILIDENTLFSITGKVGYNRLDIKLNNPDDITSIMDIREIAEIKEFGSVSVYKDRVDSYLYQAKEQMKIQLFLIFIFVFIAIVNSFNTIINNMIHRIREFYLMKTIGFTKREIFTAVAWENICYSILSVILSAGCQIILLLLNTVFNWGFSSPFLGFIILDIMIILINFILIEYGFHWTQKMNAKMET